MDERSFVVGVHYKEGAMAPDGHLTTLMADHDFLADPQRPNHFYGHSLLSPRALVNLLEGALKESKIDAFVAVELLLSPTTHKEPSLQPQP